MNNRKKLLASFLLLLIISFISIFIMDKEKMNVNSIENKSFYNDNDLDLTPFLANAFIVDAPLKSDGSYDIIPYKKYSLALEFAETPGSNDTQFPTYGILEYSLPDGIVKDMLDVSGKLSIVVNDGTKNVKVNNNSYWVDNGILYFTWSNDDNVGLLHETSNARFSMAFDVVFEDNINILSFSDEIVKSVSINHDSSLNVKKSVSGIQDGFIYYVDVLSKGYNKNVKINDIITGDGFEIDESSIHVSSNLREEIETSIEAEGKNLSISIPDLYDKEHITIQYLAKYDYSAERLNNDRFLREANNNIKVLSDYAPVGDEDSINYNDVIAPSISKTAIIYKETDTSAIVEWTIDVNRDFFFALGGKTLVDEIDAKSFGIMNYYGDGVSVKVVDSNYEVVNEELLEWDDIKTGWSNWKYKLFGTEDVDKYRYHFSYYTIVDKTIQSFSDTLCVGNTASIPGNYDTGGTCFYKNNENKIFKEYKNIDLKNKEITWEIKITIPKTGLDESNYQLIEKNPVLYVGNNVYYEPVINDSVNVYGLNSDEFFEVDYSNDKSIISFYYNPVAKIKGLQADDEDRVVTIVLKTKISDDWLNHTRKEVWSFEHINTVEFNGDNFSVPAPIKPMGLFKEVSYAGTINSNGVDLPLYRYTIKINNAEDKVYDVVDTFDNTLFEICDCGKSDAFSVNGIYGKKIDYYDIGNGFGFSFDPSEYVAYGDSYEIVYYLKVIDEQALYNLNMLAIGNENNIYKFENVVSTDGISNKAIGEYEAKLIEKEMIPYAEEIERDYSNIDEPVLFKVKYNPLGLLVNDGQRIKLTDTFNNLIIRADSIEITSSTNDIIYDIVGNTMELSFPDATPVEIEYLATLSLGEIPAVGSSVTVPISNTASTELASSEVSSKFRVTNKSYGSASITGINIYKYEAGNLGNPLENAVFQLLDSEKNPILDKDYEEVTFKSNINGFINIYGKQNEDGWTLIPGETYYVREISAPNNHKLLDNDIEFTLSTDGNVDYNNYIYNSGDVIYAKNYIGTDVKVTKKWLDNLGEETTYDSNSIIEFELQQRVLLNDDLKNPEWGEWSSTIRHCAKIDELSDYCEWKDGPMIIEIGKKDKWIGYFKSLPTSVPWSIDFSENDKIVDYRVVEVNIDGFGVNQEDILYEQKKMGGTYEFIVSNRVPAEVKEIEVRIKKELDGRNFVESDNWEFVISSNSSNAPMPSDDSIQIYPYLSNKKTFDLYYTLDDVGTYIYC